MLRLGFLFILASALVAAYPLDLLLRELRRYSDLSSFPRFLLMWLICYLIIFIALIMFNNIRAARLQFRLHGVGWLRNVRRMWALKEMSPYSFLPANSRVRRRPYVLVLLGYVAWAVSLTSISVRSNAWYKDVLLELGLIALSLAITQVAIHGRTPAVLLLGASDFQASALSLKLNLLLDIAGAASLLGLEPDVNAGRAQRLMSFNLRTADRWESRWLFIVQELISIVPNIIIDARKITPLVEEEMRLIRATPTAATVWMLGSDEPLDSLGVLPRFVPCRLETQCISRLLKKIGFSRTFILIRYRSYRSSRKLAL